MLISPTQMRRRIGLAEEIEDVIFFLFEYYVIYEGAETELPELKADAKERLTSVVEKRMKVDPYIESHIDSVVDDIVDATKRHSDTDTDTDTDDGYWTSTERAMTISANEANALKTTTITVTQRRTAKHENAGLQN